MKPEEKLTCDECNEPVFQTKADATGELHRFCKDCWTDHVTFTGNDGNPYTNFF